MSQEKHFRVSRSHQEYRWDSTPCSDHQLYSLFTSVLLIFALQWQFWYLKFFTLEISSEACETAFTVLLESTGSSTQENNKCLMDLLRKTTVTLIVLKNIHWFQKSDGSQLFSVPCNCKWHVFRLHADKTSNLKMWPWVHALQKHHMSELIYSSDPGVRMEEEKRRLDLIEARRSARG